MSGSTFGWSIGAGALAFGIALGVSESVGWALFWAAIFGSIMLGLGRAEDLQKGRAGFDIVDGLAIAASLGLTGWLIIYMYRETDIGDGALLIGLFVAIGLFGGLNFLLRVLFTMAQSSGTGVRPREREPVRGPGRGGGIDPGRFGYGLGGEAGPGPGPYGEEPFPPPYGGGQAGGTYEGEEGTGAPRLEKAWTPEGYSTQGAARYFQMTGITGSASSTEQAREFAKRIKLGLGGDAPGYAFLAAGARDHRLPKHIRAFYAHALQLCDRGQA